MVDWTLAHFAWGHQQEEYCSFPSLSCGMQLCHGSPLEPDKDTQLTVYQAVVQLTHAEVISMHLQLQTTFLSIQLKRPLERAQYSCAC